MRPVTAFNDTPVSALRAGTCFHCGDSLPAAPAHLTVQGREHAFCCDGCAAAAQWISDARLEDYYRLRSTPAMRVQADDGALSLWDREDLLGEHIRTVPDGRELTLLTDGMRCAACAWLIDRALSQLPGVLEATANAVTGRIRLRWDPERTPLSAPLRRLHALGYRPYLATGHASESARRSERNRWLLRLGVAGLGAMQAMMFAEALYLDTGSTMPLATRDFLRWITCLISTPVVFYAGWPFLAGAMRELRHRAPGMDTLIATSTLLAYVASVVETLRGGPHVWYDAAVMFVFLLLAARLVEQRIRRVTVAQVDALARARPAFATRETGDGTPECIPLAALRAGDVVRVAVGEAIPADGTVLDAATCVEESLLTGESHPVEKPPGARVFAGTLCRERPARLRVEATGAATRLSQLAQLVESAQAHRPPMARLADRIASRFVLLMLVAAALTWGTWHVIAPARALEVTLALLVISCPCALSLSIPAALAAANGALARMGLLPVRAEALEQLARMTDLVFDKTGTLTDPHPRLAELETFNGPGPDAMLGVAAALERDAGHPLAQAFLSAADARGLPRDPAAHVVAIPGLGVEGNVHGRHWRLGQARWACHHDDDGALWLGSEGRAFARFTLQEALRADARPAIAALQQQAITVHLASGDAAPAVAQVAVTLGIPSTAARQSPEQKLTLMRRLQRQGRVVGMVGDGLNDAPVLAGADVSIAMGSGAALAQRAADLVLVAPALTRLPNAVALARRTRRVIRQNLAWSVAYNVLALPLAASGLVTPWIAALGMTVSSLAVTLNALRLTRPASDTAGDTSSHAPVAA